VSAPPLDVLDASLVPAASAGGPNGPGSVQSVYTVFPIVGDSGNGQTSGDNSPVTGAGNGDLWVGSDLDECAVAEPTLLPGLSCASSQGAQPSKKDEVQP
jgi:hypothetical protein